MKGDMNMLRVIPVPVVLALLMTPVVAAEANLLPAGFESNNVGGFLGWEADTAVIRLSERGPDGGVVLRFTGNRGTYSFFHSRRKLAGGGRYRLSANVRTRAVTGADRVELMIHNWPWNAALKADIPSDTAGGWQPISCEGVLPASRGDEYDVTLYCSGGLPAEAVLDLADIALVAVDEKAVAGASPIPADKPYVARICPVDPALADVDPRQAKMRFFYSGPKVAADGAALSLRATLAGRTRLAPFTPEGYATVDFGEIPSGRHPLVVETAASLSSPAASSNRYTVIAREIVADPTPLKRLNNFVSEIASVPLANGEVPFVLAKESWVWVGTDRPYETVEADVDAEFPRVVHYRPRERGSARQLKAGRHVVRVRGVPAGNPEGRLDIRLIKPILIDGSFNSAFREDPWSRRYCHYFLDESYFDAMNVLANVQEQFSVPAGTPDSKLSPYQKMARPRLLDRGAKLYGRCSLGGQDVRRRDLDQIILVYTNTPGCLNGTPFAIDETAMSTLTLPKYNNAEAMWHLVDIGACGSTFIEDSKHLRFNRPALDIPEITACINGGEGRSHLIHEWYYRSPVDEVEYEATVRFMKDRLAELRTLVPSAVSHVFYYMNGYLNPAFWTSWIYPHVDMKGSEARMLHMLATDPDFADIGGIGLSGAYCDEDFFRYALAAINHYVIEGRTDEFAVLHDLPTFPGHLTNGDFERGFEGWQVDAAELGSIALMRRKGFGRDVQQRRGHYYVHGNPAAGDDFAVFTRSAKGPNRLAQKLTGLKPGELYQVVFATTEMSEIRQPVRVEKPERPAFRAFFANVSPIPELTHVGACVNKFEAPKPVVHVHRYVFRAKEPTAWLYLTDWMDAAAPGGEIGVAQAVNYIGCRRYFVRDEADLAFLKNYFRKLSRVK